VSRASARDEKAEWVAAVLRGPAARPPVRRLGVTAVVAAALTITAGIAAVASARPATPRPAAPATLTGAALTVAGPALAHRAGGLPAPLALTALDRKDCPAAATACVDLVRHLTWLQVGGKVRFGPVRMEPGQPGTVHATPRGTFHVAWKAGPSYMSTIYHEPMPWATFFAPGGIAFHGGSLTHWSHGCVHLTVANARYYQENLPIGAEVVVF
jgi:hypothetical protein